MSYQSGAGSYQYSNVSSSEDPLTVNNNNNNGTGTVAEMPTSAPTSTQNLNQNQSQPQPTQMPPLNNNNNNPSIYSPRAYLPTYHEYMQTNTQSFGGAFGGGGGSNGINNGNAYGNNAHGGAYYNPNIFFESQRRSRRNRIIIGCTVFFMLMILFRHPTTNEGVSVGVTSPSTDAGSSASSSASSSTASSSTPTIDNASETTTKTNIENKIDSALEPNEGTVHPKSSTSSSSTASTSTPPKITYLLTYPMSGTTYTMEIIQKSTQMALATNVDTFRPYHEKEDDTKNNNGTNLRPICVDYPSFMEEQMTLNENDNNNHEDNNIYGYPFWTESYEHGNIPSNNVLTLSHCSGFCISPCNPSQYIQTESSFEESCREVIFFNSTKSQYQSHYINRSNINAMIHLIRDPLSNVVSRFHQYFNFHQDEWLNYEKKIHAGKSRTSKENFRDWCVSMDNNVTISEIEQSSFLFSNEMKRKMKGIPCHSEFIKYISWHNHVVEMGWESNYRSMEVYFEDYAHVDKKDDVTKKMGEFLGYDDVKTTDLPSFLGGKEYREGYYTEEEVKALTEFIEYMSFSKTWELLKRYF
jgi:hypothetical protein